MVVVNMNVINSPFNFTGSKSKLFECLSGHFPDEKIYHLWDLFCGGGGMFINTTELPNPPVNVYANDIITPMMDIYHILNSKDWPDIFDMIHYHDDSITELRTDQNLYNAIRKRYNDTKDPVLFLLLVSACTNNMMRFNKKFEFNQTWGKRTYNKSTEEKLLEYWKRIQKMSVTFYNKEFYDIYIPEDEGTFVYLDPPYMITEAGYNAYWSEEHEQKLYDYIDDLHKRGVNFMLSNVSEHKGRKNPFMHRVEKYNVIDVSSEMYGKVSRKGNPNSKEIIVVNYDVYGSNKIEQKTLSKWW